MDENFIKFKSILNSFQLFPVDSFWAQVWRSGFVYRYGSGCGLGCADSQCLPRGGKAEELKRLAEDLLGPSLEDLLNFCKGRLSLKTVRVSQRGERAGSVGLALWRSGFLAVWP